MSCTPAPVLSPARSHARPLWARVLLGLLAGALAMSAPLQAGAGSTRLLSAATPGFDSALGTRWRVFTDRVMGGVSQATLEYDEVEGEPCLRLRGGVRLDNGGGFVQMALDLGEGPLDASAWRGLRLRVNGNGERYNLHLRTPDLSRPWQSYRAAFTAGPGWRDVDLPFAGFEAHRTEAAFDPRRLVRVGLLGIGRAFQTDVCLAGVSLYR